MNPRHPAANMNILPYERLVIASPLPIEDASAKLRNVIEPAHIFGWDKPGIRPYRGVLREFTFRLVPVRLFGWRPLPWMKPIFVRPGGFMPVIKGAIDPEVQGSSIRLSIRPDGAVTCFVALWLAFLLFEFTALLYVKIDSLRSGATLIDLIVLAGPLLFALLLYGWYLRAFKTQAARQRAFFSDLLEARCVDDIGLLTAIRRGQTYR